MKYSTSKGMSSFSQRGNLDRKNVKAVKQVTAEHALCDGSLQIVVSSSNHANLSWDGSVSKRIVRPSRRVSARGLGLTAEDMKKCVWVRPKLVAQIEFLEWTQSERAASDYTRSSNTTREVS